MAQRGARKGAARKTSTGKTAAAQTGSNARVTNVRRAIRDLSPVDYMLSILRDKTQSQVDRMDAAKAAAPYLHARLSGVKHSGEMVMRHEDALNELDDARKTNSRKTSR
ncbi:hypothetical protein [Bradyrhizobium sp. SYSU BS000235]|uniref:hypothetical protein n=1 Tax=Bradyrhizobium sp. SYSU BS000235 TaxID=3411332 RepID=UPI003C77D045